jgi:hypothetical protein
MSNPLVMTVALASSVGRTPPAPLDARVRRPRRRRFRRAR